MILSAEHFDAVRTQKWFTDWLILTGKSIGQEVQIYEYQVWNSAKWCGFKKLNGYPENTPLSHIDGAVERFDEYLEGLKMLL